MKKLLLDCSAIMNPFKYTIDKTDLNQIIYGFFNKVLQLSFKFRTKDIIFCWEGKDKNFKQYRKQLYPPYKRGVDKDGNIKEDERTPEEIEYDNECYKIFDQIRDMVEGIGFKNSFSQKGTEADDILAQICKQSEDPFEDIIMVTSDEDMFDCLKYGTVKIYLYSKEKLVDKNKFVEMKGIDPKDWWKVKTIGGCSSDKVVGVKGVGEGSAIKYLNGTLKESSVYYQRIIDHPKELRSRDSKLVKIPIPQTKAIKLLNDEATMEKFVAYCYENGFDTFLNETYDSWEKFFGKRETAKQRREKQRNDNT